jgi:hypothetical protein
MLNRVTTEDTEDTASIRGELLCMLDPAPRRGDERRAA